MSHFDAESNEVSIHTVRTTPIDIEEFKEETGGETNVELGNRKILPLEIKKTPFQEH
jgi:hypothetical protein